jgi:hypothetical protein
MKISWQLYRLACLLQMLATSFFSFASLISLFNSGKGYYFLETIFFVLMAALSIFALNLVNTNYPDKPVAGKQKNVFNWLFLVNFFLLIFLFGLFFAEYRSLGLLRSITGGSLFSLPFRFLVPLLFKTAILVFQLVILYGLFNLRRELYRNFFVNKQFEFEDGVTQEQS